MNNFAIFKDNLPIFIPLIILELILMIFAVRDILKHNRFRFGNKVLWLLIVILIQMIGPVVYFIFGRRNEE